MTTTSSTSVDDGINSSEPSPSRSPSPSTSASSSWFGTHDLAAAAKSSFWLFLPGAAQGATTVLLGHPFDTAKTRLQADTALTLQTRSSLRVMQRMIKREGFISLYRGVTPPLAIMGSKRGLQFALWEQIKRQKSSGSKDDPKKKLTSQQRLKDEHEVFSLDTITRPLKRITTTIANNNFFSGAFSGACGTILGCPMHVIKIQTQNLVSESGGGKKWNAYYCTRNILQRDGMRGLYRGFRFHVLKDTLFAGTYLGMYEHLRVALSARYDDAEGSEQSEGPSSFLRSSSPEVLAGVAPSVTASNVSTKELRRNATVAAAAPVVAEIPTNNNNATANNKKQPSSNLTIFTAGVLASCVTWIVLYPLDTLKTAVQARNAIGFKGFVALMSANPAAVYRGFSAALVRAGPVSGSAMVAYESTKRWVNNNSNTKNQQQKSV